MTMKKIIADFRRGIETLRWLASLFAERLKIEIAVFRLLYESDRMAKTRDDLLKKIGERVMELKDRHERDILKDGVVAGAVAEIGSIEKNIDDLKGKVSEIGRVTE